MRATGHIFLFLFSCLSLAGQSQLSETLNFARHLRSVEQYRNAVIVLDDAFNPSESGIMDSVFYESGKNYLQLKSLDTAASKFGMVKSFTPLSPPAVQYRAFCLAYLGQHSLADSLLLQLKLLPSDSLSTNCLRFQQMAASLLTRNYSHFEVLSKTAPPYMVEQNALLKYHSELQKIKNKSPALAGVFSAIIPGSGKYYAGYRGKALATFFINAALAAVAAECYVKGGLKSPAFIGSGLLFLTFYSGNIIGSVYSVKLWRKEKFRKIDNEIYYDMLAVLHSAYP